ncbi:hypothetical protein I7I52_00594 [Histoplasma capsulatum]|uniref:Uncharacterized protein n=1 Tax=Ajellomyces capsulatus TaxID=5037 RepID=A0A8H7Z7Y8_AJECA|nr:hypothetical protein I7I52_00594 [Histoplasma capsulatum]
MSLVFRYEIIFLVNILVPKSKEDDDHGKTRRQRKNRGIFTSLHTAWEQYRTELNSPTPLPPQDPPQCYPASSSILRWRRCYAYSSFSSPRSSPPGLSLTSRHVMGPGRRESLR